MTGIVLCGGKNTRIKVKKAFLKTQGQVIIENILEKFKMLFDEIIIIANNPLDYRHLNAEVVKDIIPDMGPLGGIYTALTKAKNFHSFVAACDMPFIYMELVKYMRSEIKDYDVIVPRWNNKFEPLFAFYSKRCIEPIKKQLEKNDPKIINFYNKVNLKIIKKNQIKKIDPDLLSFFNINTELDYKESQIISPQS